MIEYGFGLLLLNITLYLALLLLLFCVFFLFGTNNFRTLNEFKNLVTLNFIYILLFFSILSLAGVPPLLGFIGKFLLIIFILFKAQYFFFFFFSLVNMFVIYFYIQNLRFLLKKTKDNLTNLRSAISINCVFLLAFFNFFNIFGIFFINNLIIYFNNLSFYIYIC